MELSWWAMLVLVVLGYYGVICLALGF